jgi:hypothetical protein
MPKYTLLAREKEGPWIFFNVSTLAFGCAVVLLSSSLCWDREIPVQQRK